MSKQHNKNAGGRCDPERGRCAGCGREIIWATIGDRRVPLSVAAPVYLVRHHPGEGTGATFIRAGEGFDAINRGTTGAFASHFADCPARDRFSGANRPAAPDPQPQPPEENA